jgi:hypothetical protein
VELAADPCRVADEEHVRALSRQEPLGRLEDPLIHAGRLVDDEEQVVGVVALEAFRLVRGQSDREPLDAQLELRR